MQQNDTASIVYGVPREFYCEHSVSKSRVLAVIHTPSYHSTVQAVLTCKDRVMAELAAHTLSEVAQAGRGPHVNAVIVRLAEQLPAAPAASLAQAVQRADENSWPLDADQLVRWSELRAEFGFEQRPDMAATPALRDEHEHTPGGARLEDLTGDVIRMVSLLEVHVHDRQRLLKAASAAGLIPDPNEDDDVHVLDAVMYLADSGRVPPGAASIENATNGEYLSAAAGDEIAEWSDVPVTVDFGIGWRVSSARRRES